MRRRIFLMAFAGCLTVSAPAAGEADALVATYQGWREAMVRKDARQWQALTAAHRQMEVRNRLASEKRPFPAAVFDLPAPPPTLDGLKLLQASVKGATAKATFFGAIDFGVGGAPTENLLVLSFIAEAGRWKYDRADFVNLAALAEVRKEIKAGDLGYLKETPEFQATGIVPPAPVAVPPAKYIAKVYAFCPGREVQVQVNQISRHRFANAQEAEIVIGGARDGRNEITFAVKPLPGAQGGEAFTVRVYLMSEVPGTKPIKAYEYLVEEGGPVKGFETGTFTVDPATAAKLVSGS